MASTSAAAAPAPIPITEESINSSSSSSSSASAAAIFKRLHPTQYLSRFLTKGYRPDGRKLSSFRDVSVNVGSISTANGSSLVRIGETTMVCGIKAEISEPSASEPNQGFIVPNIDLPALCSPKFKPGPPGDQSQTYSNWLNDLLTSSRTLDPTTLVISPGKSVWVIYIDIVCINYDGNAFDAAVLAVMSALKNTRLPRARYNDDTGKTTCSRDEMYPLKLGRIPLSCSFGIFDSTHLLPDPTSFESPLLPTTLTIALDEDDHASLIRQEGLGGVIGASGEKFIGRAWGIAEERVKELRRILEEST